MRLRILSAAAVAVLVLSATALAAVTGRYTGTNSQSFALHLKLYHKGSKLYADGSTKFKFKCPSGPTTQPTTFSDILVTHQGNGYSISLAESGAGSDWSWQINGKKLSGSATTWFEASGGGECRSGKVTFTATR